MLPILLRGAASSTFLALLAREGQRLRIVQTYRGNARQAEGAIVQQFWALRPDLCPTLTGR